MKAILSTVALMLISVPAFAISTSVTYSSGILVLLFVGFCSLLIIAQIIPAILILFGAIKAVKPVSKKVTTKG